MPGSVRFAATRAPIAAGQRLWAGTRNFVLVKVNPLANWTKRDVWKMVTDFNVPYNPLHDKGYTGITMLAVHASGDGWRR